MSNLVEKFGILEEIASTEVGRGSAELSRNVRGQLGEAVVSLLGDSGNGEIWIITGFYLPKATIPAAETDGPLGAVQLACALEKLGKKVVIITDELCAPVVTATAVSAKFAGTFEIAPVGDLFDSWLESFRDRHKENSARHVISIERVGNSGNGRAHNMRGIDITEYTAPLGLLFTDEWGTTVGIGDGGNELGMGSIPAQLVADLVPLGDQVHCITPCKFLIVAGTSNWGASAVTAGLALLSRNSELNELLTTHWSQTHLEASVKAGACDGVTLLPTSTVDGLPALEYEKVINRILDVVTNADISKRGTDV